MTDELKRTVRIQRKVHTDDRGRSVWSGKIDTVELELVSTTMLRKIIDTNDAREKERLRLAAAGQDGILARDTGSGGFEIIDDEDLKAALAEQAKASKLDRPADVTLEPLSMSPADEEFSLVSTMMLKKMLGNPVDPEVEQKIAVKKAGGFDPYNSG